MARTATTAFKILNNGITLPGSFNTIDLLNITGADEGNGVVSFTGTGSGGSGTFSTEVPTGTVNDSNLVFTVLHAPAYIVVNGNEYIVGTGIFASYAAGTVTLSAPVGTGGFIYSVYAPLVPSSVSWGSIIGTLSDQTDLQAALNLKSPIASPTFTGLVTLPDTFFNGMLAYSSEFSNGNSGAAKTIDWAANGNYQSVVITANTTLTFTAPTGPTGLTLKVIHEIGTTTTYTITFSPTPKKPASMTAYVGPPSVSGGYDLLNFYFDGAGNYDFVAAANLA